MQAEMRGARSQSPPAPCAAWRWGAPGGALPRTQKVLWNSYGHGREPTVFWGMKDARGRRLAWERDVEALILMGVWCGAHTADTTRQKTEMRLWPHVGGGVCQAARNGKKLSKVV